MFWPLFKCLAFLIQERRTVSLFYSLSQRDNLPINMIRYDISPVCNFSFCVSLVNIKMMNIFFYWFNPPESGIHIIYIF